MVQNFNTPKELVTNYMTASEAKVKQTILKLLLLGILGGACISFGAVSSSLAMHGIKDVGLARTIAGCIFPVGLMMIVVLGAELFTGDCLMIMGALDKRYSIGAMLRVICLVYISNFAGAILVAVLINYSGQLNYSDMGLGAFTIKLALSKTSIDFIPALVSGILCNILVCIAVLMAGAAKDIAGKLLAIFFPIAAFVIGGFEHCVANMYYIPAGILAAMNPAYREKSAELYGITDIQLDGLNWGTLFTKNQLPVTLGNIIGGMLCVGVLLWFVHRSPKTDANRH